MDFTSSKVSVIIPNYNRGDLILETLLSLQVQSYTNWEAIVVDDGSNDDSWAKVSDFQRRDNRIKLLKRDRLPKGAPTCRNIGIEKASGELIIFLDSDDLLAPYCLGNRVQSFIKYKHLDFIVFPMLSFNEYVGDSDILWNIPTKDPDLTRFLASDIPWAVTGPIWKKESILKIGKWDEEALAWQDWEFHIRALVSGLQYKVEHQLPDCFVRRGNNTRISAGNVRPDQLTSRLILFEKIFRLLAGHNQLNENNRNAFAGTFFSNAEKSALYCASSPIAAGFLHKMKSFDMLPSSFSQLVFQYISLVRIFRSKNIPLIPALLMQTLRKFLPAYLVNRQNYHLKVRLNTADLNQIKSAMNFPLKSANREPGFN